MLANIVVYPHQKCHRPYCFCISVMSKQLSQTTTSLRRPCCHKGHKYTYLIKSQTTKYSQSACLSILPALPCSYINLNFSYFSHQMSLKQAWTTIRKLLNSSTNKHQNAHGTVGKNADNFRAGKLPHFYN